MIRVSFRRLSVLAVTGALLLGAVAACGGPSDSLVRSRSA